MLSLAKIYSKEDLVKWVRKVSRNSTEAFMVQPKYDGMSGLLENGTLSSRGDGIHGQDYTDKLKMIEFDSCEKIDPKTSSLLGEIIIRNSDFNRIYPSIRSKAGIPFKNQRNGIAGILGTDDVDFYYEQGAKITFVDYNKNSWFTTCKKFENDDISVCANTKLPPDTQFWRPFEYGGVSSEYGYRYDIYVNGKLISGAGIHEGIDLTNGLGSANKIYSIANGKVAAVWYDRWGGNQITIHHNINGKSYSSSYAHMSRTFVKVGDIVSKDTVIGMMGSTGNVTGPHLHLAISTGLRFTEYRGQSAYVARTVNPRSLINFPSRGGWKDRITKYN